MTLTCTCGACDRLGPTCFSDPACPWGHGKAQRDHERELEWDEARFERRQAERERARG